MKIKGRTVGTTMPRPDWSQTDPKKADYIYNKPKPVVYDKTQTLSDEQKRRARNNIGAVGTKAGELPEFHAVKLKSQDSTSKDGVMIGYDASENNFGVATFKDTYFGTNPVILRNIAPGTASYDAVNKWQMDSAISTKAVRYDMAYPYTEEQKQQAMDNIGASEALALRSQGRSAKYTVTKPGWKRILNVIRASNGTLNLGIGKVVSGGGGISFQALGIQFTGNVDLKTGSIDKTEPKPVIYQLYNHEMGHNNNTAFPDSYARITGVRVGWPGHSDGSALKEADFPNIPEGDTVKYWINTVNCYVDVYVDFVDVKGGDTVQLNMNYAGFADSHRCGAITEETDATDTGIYGEPLVYQEFTPTKDYTVYMPEGKMFAKELEASSFAAEQVNVDDVALRGNVVTDQDKLAVNALILEGDPGNVDTEDVILRGLHPGQEDTDAVNKGQLEGALSASELAMTDKLCPAFSESGAVVTCEPVEEYPLQAVSQIAPVQAGSGDPGPDNIRAISGHTEVQLTRAGKNLFDDVGWFESHGFTLQEDGSWLGFGVNKPCFTNTAKQSGAMYLTATAQTNDNTVPFYMVAYYTDGTVSSSLAFYAADTFATKTLTTDPTKTVDYIKWTYGGGGSYYIKDVMISFVDGEYEPYKGDTFTVDLGQTVYGGSVDWQSGALTAQWVCEELSVPFYMISEGRAAFKPTYPVDYVAGVGNICSSHYKGGPFDASAPDNYAYVANENTLVIRDNANFGDAAATSAYLAAQKAAGTPVQVCYRTKTPIGIVNLTPQEIKALAGVNTVWSDTGDTQVTGRADTKALFEKLTNAIIALGGNV